MPACIAASTIALAERPDMRRIRHAQRTADAVEFVRAAFVVLGLLEERQHGIPVPALAAELAPVVVVGRIAAHIHHAVDRAGAAQHLAARQIQRAVVQCLLWRAVEHPVDARIGECLGVADRECGSTDCCRGCRLPAAAPDSVRTSDRRRRHDAPGRAGAGDDEVVFGSVRHRQITPPPLAGGGRGGGRANSAAIARTALAHAVTASFTPSSAAIRSRMMNFCILPVTVIGNSSTKRMCRGTL